jgi:hypothetical protein
MNKKLKAQIVEHFGSQFLFSQALGIHEAYVSLVVRGKRSLSGNDKKKWVAALKCSEEIFNHEAIGN